MSKQKKAKRGKKVEAPKPARQAADKGRCWFRAELDEKTEALKAVPGGKCRPEEVRRLNSAARRGIILPPE